MPGDGSHRIVAGASDSPTKHHNPISMSSATVPDMNFIAASETWSEMVKW
jgi:hypothetical protein